MPVRCKEGVLDGPDDRQELRRHRVRRCQVEGGIPHVDKHRRAENKRHGHRDDAFKLYPHPASPPAGGEGDTPPALIPEKTTMSLTSSYWGTSKISQSTGRTSVATLPE